MTIAFFVSSIGDTDLAFETMTALIEKGYTNEFYAIPLSATGQKRSQEKAISPQIKLLAEPLINSKDIEDFLNKHSIDRAYVGVPSENQYLPFQVAKELATKDIPCTVAYEFMFSAPQNHCFWTAIPELTSAKLDYAVSLSAAKKDILNRNPDAKINIVGHLSIDRAIANNTMGPIETKEKLEIKANEEFIFISGTTQPINVDSEFALAILNELASNNYPNLQIRFGLHPGIPDKESYLNTLLSMCAKYPHLSAQFKIILSPPIEQQVKSEDILNNSFIVRVNVSGPEAANAAAKIAQAVPGALLNESVIKGKPSYFHREGEPYLPRDFFSNNIQAFFNATTNNSPHTKKDLDLNDSTTAENMANIMCKK
ncbi:MAG: Uncharacterized protein K0R48_158 [Gammaproteobacteria bacterium]|jgi:hypothetical protein|nr:Uncharacterized protein [Gammaproteobacteria bacterium]